MLTVELSLPVRKVFLSESGSGSKRHNQEAMIKMPKKKSVRYYIKRVRDEHYQFKNLTTYYIPSILRYSKLTF